MLALLASVTSMRSSFMAQALYDLGARKFALINVPPVGCCPISRVRHPLGACLDGLNTLTKGFNDRVSVLVKNLSSEMEGMKYTIGNSYNVVMSIISDPAGVGKLGSTSHVAKRWMGSG